MIPVFTINDYDTWDGIGETVYINPINVVSIEPARTVLFAYYPMWRRSVECSRIITNAAKAVATRKNDPYTAWRNNLPDVETVGGGYVSYLVPLEREAVAHALRRGDPVRCCRSVEEWINKRESADRAMVAASERGECGACGYAPCGCDQS